MTVALAVLWALTILLLIAAGWIFDKATKALIEAHRIAHDLERNTTQP